MLLTLPPFASTVLIAYCLSSKIYLWRFEITMIDPLFLFRLRLSSTSSEIHHMTKKIVTNKPKHFWNCCCKFGGFKDPQQGLICATSSTQPAALSVTLLRGIAVVVL